MVLKAHWLRCDWSNWETTGQTQVKNKDHVVALYVVQRKICIQCDKVKYRKEKVFDIRDN